MLGKLQQGWRAKGRCGREVGDAAGSQVVLNWLAHEVIRTDLELRQHARPFPGVRRSHFSTITSQQCEMWMDDRE